MTNKEAVTYGNELIQCSTGPLREFAELATRALRSPGAGAMREAAARVAHREGLKWQRLSSESAPIADACRTIEKQIRALPLPAPEVPEAVKVWAARHDKWVEARETMNVIEYNLRDWIRKEYGI